MRGAFGGKIWTFAALALLLSLLSTVPAAAEKRIALVVGNSAYQNVTRLDNPRNDAALMADTLAGLGFTLIGGRAQLDLDKSAMDTAVQNFGRQVQGADVALFYYAGHGVQVAGSNYLVPVSANPTREADVDFQMVDVNLVLRQMQGSGTRLNMVILDACRNNPFGARGLRASDGGLAQMRAPEGTLISYATQPGNVAQDGTDGNSPYTKALASTIKQSGPRYLPDLQPGRPRGEARDRRRAAALGVVLADRRHLLFRRRRARPPRRRSRSRRRPSRSSPARCAPIPTGSRSRIVALLRELSDRLYEHNFDPEPLDSKNGMRLAISQFQAQEQHDADRRGHRGRADAAAQDGRSEALGLDRLRPRQQQMGHLLESRFAARGGRRCAQELRIEQMSARAQLLWIALRRVCDLGEFLLAGSARHGPARQGGRA